MGDLGDTAVFPEINREDPLVDQPGGGESGGRIVATGTPEQVAANPNSITGRYLR